MALITSFWCHSDFTINMHKASVLQQDVVSTLAALANMPVCQRAIADAGAIRPLARLLHRQTQPDWLELHSTNSVLLNSTLGLFLKLSDHPGVVRDSNSGHQLRLPPANWCPIFAPRTTQQTGRR